MSKRVSFVILLLMLFMVTTCKKDYPNDIPKWVRDKIKGCKQKRLDNGGSDQLAGYTIKYCDFSIHEYTDMKYGFVYGIDLGCGGFYVTIEYYDKDSNFICDGVHPDCPSLYPPKVLPPSVLPPIKCDSTFNPVYVRTIYSKQY